MTQDTPGAPPTWTPPAGNDTAGVKNQRRRPRRRVLKEGKVIFGQNHSIVDRTIDNESEGGAHIRIVSSKDVPEEFYLVEASRGIIHKAEVAWRSATNMGVRLLGPLEDATAGEAFLRRFRRGSSTA